MQAKTVSGRATAHTQPAARRKRPRYKLQTGLLLVSPWLIGLLLFNLLPILASLILSLTDFFLLTPNEIKFIGWQNYAGVFEDPRARSVLFETFRLALIIIPVQTSASILLAAVLSNQKLMMKNTMRVLFFFPSVIPAAAATFMWRGFFNTDSGWANRLLLGPLAWTGSASP
jgi:ABC-type sugar transport system permease subunit